MDRYLGWGFGFKCFWGYTSTGRDFVTLTKDKNLIRLRRPNQRQKSHQREILSSDSRGGKKSGGKRLNWRELDVLSVA
jgi:hypothetical protein